MKNVRNLVFVLIWLSFQTLFAEQVAVVDYLASRDEQAVTAMLCYDAQLLNFATHDDVQKYVGMIASWPTRKFKVVRDQERTVGFVDYKQKTLDSWYIQFIVVDPVFRNRGYAKSLMQAVLQDCSTMPDVATVRLHVQANNHAARSLYVQSFGFQEKHGESAIVELVKEVR